MNKPVNVLIFPAGEINSIELHNALATCVNIKVFGASSIERHGSYVFENYIPNLPLISNDNFITIFNMVLRENNIDLIFPTHDTVAEYLSNHANELVAKIATSSSKTNEICRNKKLTFELFKNELFCPKIYSTVTQKIQNTL